MKKQVTNTVYTSSYPRKNSEHLPDCPLYLGGTTQNFFNTPLMPTQDGVFSSLEQEALWVPMGKINLFWCSTCSYACNEDYDPIKIQFNNYDFSLTESPASKKYEDEVCQHSISKYELKEKTILDVGCGIGYLPLLEK